MKISVILDVVTNFKRNGEYFIVNLDSYTIITNYKTIKKTPVSNR